MPRSTGVHAVAGTLYDHFIRFATQHHESFPCYKVFCALGWEEIFRVSGMVGFGEGGVGMRTNNGTHYVVLEQTYSWPVFLNQCRNYCRALFVFRVRLASKRWGCRALSKVCYLDIEDICAGDVLIYWPGSQNVYVDWVEGVCAARTGCHCVGGGCAVCGVTLWGGDSGNAAVPQFTGIAPRLFGQH